jgi:hypothetical protein
MAQPSRGEVDQALADATSPASPDDLHTDTVALLGAALSTAAKTPAADTADAAGGDEQERGGCGSASALAAHIVELLCRCLEEGEPPSPQEAGRGAGTVAAAAAAPTDDPDGLRCAAKVIALGSSLAEIEGVAGAAFRAAAAAPLGTALMPFCRAAPPAPPPEVVRALAICTADTTAPSPDAQIAILLGQATTQDGVNLVPLLASRLRKGMEEGDGGSTHVVAKTLSILASMVPKGSTAFRSRVKADCTPLLMQAQHFERAATPRSGDYGDKPKQMIQRRAGGVLGLLLGDGGGGDAGGGAEERVSAAGGGIPWELAGAASKLCTLLGGQSGPDAVMRGTFKIGARSDRTTTIDDLRPGGSVRWRFELQKHDVKLHILVETGPAHAPITRVIHGSGAEDGAQPVVLHSGPQQAAAGEWTHVAMSSSSRSTISTSGGEGVVGADTPHAVRAAKRSANGATVMFCWDNTYSKARSKTVQYQIEVNNPPPPPRLSSLSSPSPPGSSTPPPPASPLSSSLPEGDPPAAGHMWSSPPSPTPAAQLRSCPELPTLNLIMDEGSRLPTQHEQGTEDDWVPVSQGMSSDDGYYPKRREKRSLSLNRTGSLSSKLTSTISSGRENWRMAVHSVTAVNRLSKPARGVAAKLAEVEAARKLEAERVTAWRSEVLPSWSSHCECEQWGRPEAAADGADAGGGAAVSVSARVLELLGPGVPQAVRAAVWRRSGWSALERQGVNRQLYEATLAKVSQCKREQKAQEQKAQEQTVAGGGGDDAPESVPLTPTARARQLISLDLERTCSFGLERHADFAKPGTLEQLEMRQVLEAFAHHRPDFGYCQGLSFVAATLIRHTAEAGVLSGKRYSQETFEQMELSELRDLVASAGGVVNELTQIGEQLDHDGPEVQSKGTPTTAHRQRQEATEKECLVERLMEMQPPSVIPLLHRPPSSFLTSEPEPERVQPTPPKQQQHQQQQPPRLGDAGGMWGALETTFEDAEPEPELSSAALLTLGRSESDALGDEYSVDTMQGASSDVARAAVELGKRDDGTVGSTSTADSPQQVESEVQGDELTVEMVDIVPCSNSPASQEGRSMTPSSARTDHSEADGWEIVSPLLDSTSSSASPDGTTAYSDSDFLKCRKMTTTDTDDVFSGVSPLKLDSTFAGGLEADAGISPAPLPKTRRR